MIRKMTFAFICGMLLAGAPTALMGADPNAADLVAKLPATTITDGQAVAAEIVKLGPGAIKDICKMLQPPGAGDDTKAEFALHGLALYVGRNGAEEERKMYAGAVIEALAAENRPEVKPFLISLLQLAGKDESVVPLSRLLGDAALCEPAARALVQIGTPAAADALAKALPAAKGANRVSLICALGDLGHAGSVKALIQDAASEDADVRRPAIYALARIGDPAAVDVLAKAAQVQAPYERALAANCYLLLSQRLAQAGQKDACAKICRDLIKTRTAARENNIQCAALRTLVLVVGSQAADDVLLALESPSLEVREAALNLKGEEVTAKLVAKMKQVPPQVQAEIIHALGRRGDPSAMGTVAAALKDKEKVVRLAAISSLGRFKAKEVLSGLLGVLGSDQADEVKAAKDAMMLLAGDEVMAAVAAALPNVPVGSRVALVELLAARRATAHAGAVLAAAKDADAAVRLAAIKALAELADEKALADLSALLLSAQDEKEQTAAQKTIVIVAQKDPDAENRAGPIVAAMARAEGEKRVLLLRVLGRIGGARALAAVLADSRSGDPKVQDAAIRALIEWPDAGAAPALLNIVRSSDKPAYQVLALRGYIRLAGMPSDRPAAQTVRMYRDAMNAAKRPEDKKLVLGGLCEVRNLDALKLAAAYLDDEALQAEAALAAVKIASPQGKEKGLFGEEVTAIMKKVAQVAKDENVRNQAKSLIDRTPRDDSRNKAGGKKAKTSCNQQGDNAPALALDGDSSSLDSAWFGDRWPSWLEVDLGEPTKIDCVHVFPYWGGDRFYQYTVEASLDEKDWRKVVDMSANTAPSTPGGDLRSFDPVEARYVRINVLKNSANEAVHLVELKVFGPEGRPSDRPVATRSPDAPPEKAPASAPASKPADDEKDFVVLFNGKDLTGWIGATKGYIPKDGVMVCPRDKGGNLYTEKEYGDFMFRFDFKLTPGANNGVGIRTPPQGDAAYVGMEIQILDDSADQYKNLQPYQYHGSIYGVVAAKRGHQKPLGEWNSEEIIARGRRITVVLNGVTIVDADIDKASAGGTTDHRNHPGLKRTKGHIGFLGHGSHLEFRNIRIKDLGEKENKE